jgi:hypothetical protein
MALNDDQKAVLQEEKWAGTITATAAKRIKCCVLIESGMSTKKACAKVGLSRTTWIGQGWYESYLEGGMNALLHDQRGGTASQFTPQTNKRMRLHADKGKNAPEIRTLIIAEREEANEEREAPTVRGVQMQLNKMPGASYGRKKGKFMVKTPWHARWRLQFAIEWLELLRAKRPNRKVRLDCLLFTDEKNFCLWDSRFGRWTFDDTELNAARANDWTDEEYIAWQEVNGKPLPHTKQRGLYPWFVWGAVGKDMKTDLYFLEHGQKLTADIYLNILEKTLKPKLREFTRQLPVDGVDVRPSLYMTQDNDAKHYNDASKAWLEANKIKGMFSKRCKADGFHPDRAKGPGGHMKDWVEARFPCYSPDFNGPIEKAWRECQRRVMARAASIKTRAQMMAAIKEEWAGLEFERTDHWCGINHLVDNIELALEEASKNGGWDTSFHHH